MCGHKTQVIIVSEINETLTSHHNFIYLHFIVRLGDYICQIGDQETRDQVHTVEILGKFCNNLLFMLYLFFCIPLITYSGARGMTI